MCPYERGPKELAGLFHHARIHRDIFNSEQDPHLATQTGTLVLDFQLPEWWEINSCGLQTTQSVAFCYSTLNGPRHVLGFAEDCPIVRLFQQQVRRWASQVALVVKKLPANAGDAGDVGSDPKSLNQEDPLEKEMATHTSTLAWKIPWTEEPGGPQSMGLQRVRHNSVSMHRSQKAAIGLSSPPTKPSCGTQTSPGPKKENNAFVFKDPHQHGNALQLKKLIVREIRL